MDTLHAKDVLTIDEARAPAPDARVRIRPGRVADAEAAGRIVYEAFAAIAREHNFPADFPSPEAATELWRWMTGNAGFYSVVAEQDGRVVGSNFLDGRGPIAGVGPISVHPAVQNKAVGRRLMEAVHKHAEARGAAGVRLVQSAYHRRSLSLYAKLGYAVREPLACMQGPPPRVTFPGRTVRAARADDRAACDQLAARILGHARSGELADAIARGAAHVVESDGRISGYTSGIGFLGHAVGETIADLQALIAAAPSIAGPGVLVPMRNEPLFRWCLETGLRVVQPMTLMSRGPYNEPEGAFLPSVLY
jgi:predicted N-acetyltransferase YhbS